MARSSRPSAKRPGQGDTRPADQRILAAARAGLTRLDPAALTIQRICQEAQVTPPTLYYHFGSKDGLVAAAVEQLAADWIDLLDLLVPRRGNLAETLAAAEQGWEAMVCAPDRPLAVFAWVTLLSAESSARAREALARARDRTLDLVRAALLPHVHDGGLAGDLAMVVLDAVIAAALEHHLDGDLPSLRRRLAAITRTVHSSAAAAADECVSPAPGRVAGGAGQALGT